MKAVPRLTKSKYFPYVLIAIVTLALYGQVVTFHFTDLDDLAIILDNYSVIGDLSNIDQAFTHDAFLQVTGGEFYRPMQTVSFMVDAAIGGSHPWIYHTTNLLIHLATCCLLYYLLVSVLNFPSMLSLFFSLLFSVHPLFTHAVAWVPSRGDLLIACLGLLSFVAYRRYVQRGRWQAAALHGVSFLLAIFSKETALLFPLVYVFDHFAVKRGKLKDKRVWILAGMWVVSIALYGFLRSHFLGTQVSKQGFGFGSFLKNLPIPLLFIGKFFVPHRLTTMPMIDAPSVVIGAGIVVMLGIAIFLGRASMRFSLIGLGSVWFLCFVGPSLLYRHPLADVAYQFFEHRSYLPCVGLIIVISETLIAHGSVLAWKFLPRLAGIVLLLFAGLAAYHCRDYATPIAFYDATLADNPNNAMAYNNKGVVKFSLGDFQGALAEFSGAIAIKNDYAYAYLNRALVYGQYRAYDKALVDYDKSIQYDSTKPMVYFNRAIVRWMLHDNAGSIDDCNHSLKLLPKFWLWYYHRGNVEADIGQPTEALRDFDTAIEYYGSGKVQNDPRYNTVVNNPTAFSDVYAGRAKVNRILGKAQDAISDCNRAIGDNPNNAEAYFQRGLTRVELMHDTTGALSDLAATLAIQPQHAPAYYSRGLLKEGMHDHAGACEDWQRASRLGWKQADTLMAKYGCGK